MNNISHDTTDKIDSELERIYIDKDTLNNPKFKYSSPESRMLFERSTHEQFAKIVKEVDAHILKAKKEDVGLKEFEMFLDKEYEKYRGVKSEYYIYDISNIYILIGDLVVICNVNTLEEYPIFTFSFLGNNDCDSNKEDCKFFDYGSLLRKYKHFVVNGKC